ncbi:hypothetical protein [Paracoccus tibetensis]|uniref:Uncharacterized protein n=1 Tax=Paracoccus tibetensis TaxID=336292 RepID=A0A1G5H0I6_9RHOB|nr:hypothetical protein [Paracoccus tibetensis]SCY57372.1 hypothetical protein SAMN05660710_01921 [Paracoccus tibetensis]
MADSTSAAFAPSSRSGSLIWSVVAISICLLFLMVNLCILGRTGIEPSLLYRDANAIAGQPFYYGILEGLTATLLIASGAIMIFSAFSDHAPRSPSFRFCLVFGLLTFVMGLDDLLMLHESAWFFHWRLTETHVYLVYAAALVFSLTKYREAVRTTPFPLLVIALVALAVAGVEDMLALGHIPEDYVEIIGFSFWFCFAVASCFALKHVELSPD